MSEFDTLRRILDHVSGMSPEQRQFGKTRSAADLTRRVGGILLLHDRLYAKQVAKQYDVRTDSIQSYCPEGRREPVVVDQDAWAFEARRLLRSLDKACDEIDRLRAKLASQAPYCLGRETIQRLAAEGQLEAAGYAFIAASDLFKKDPYKRVEDAEARLADEQVCLGKACDEIIVQRERAEAAEARAERLREALKDALDPTFPCCGGSDEHPPEHTQDCPCREALAADRATDTGEQGGEKDG